MFINISIQIKSFFWLESVTKGVLNFYSRLTGAFLWKLDIGDSEQSK